ncbi:MAG: hypothetical protein N3I86_13565, partial [Verrucomicrobiae bacterium]|nr:hypothetical protein [Verrucomicrobiae bacterium]
MSIGWGRVATAQVSLPFHEPFPLTYTNGALLGSATGGGAIWTGGNSVGTGSAIIANVAALSYSGLATGGGTGLLQPGPGTARN